MSWAGLSPPILGRLTDVNVRVHHSGRNQAASPLPAQFSPVPVALPIDPDLTHRHRLAACRLDRLSSARGGLTKRLKRIWIGSLPSRHSEAAEASGHVREIMLGYM
jgi:hypothetical protein